MERWFGCMQRCRKQADFETALQQLEVTFETKGLWLSTRIIEITDGGPLSAAADPW